MNYFKNKNNEIFAYDDEQIEQVNQYSNAVSNVGLDNVDDTVTYKESFPSWVVDLSNKMDNLTPITEAELAELQKPTQAELDAQKVSEAKAYLASTDFKVLPDYDKDTTDVRVKRQEAREFIRANEGDN